MHLDEEEVVEFCVEDELLVHFDRLDPELLHIFVVPLGMVMKA